MAVAYALINGLQLIQCVTPTQSERTCAVFAEALENLQVMDDFGRFEISCLYYGSSDLVAASQRPYTAQLIVDGMTIDLGRLPGGDLAPLVVTRFVPEYPKSLELRVFFSETPSNRHPDESLLIDEVRSIVTDPHSQIMGATTRATIHNRLKDLELYTRVTENVSFRTLLAQHPELVALDVLPNGEPHIVLAERLTEAKQSQAAHQVMRKRQEKAILDKLLEILEPGDLDYRVVLQQMSALPEFTAALSGSGAILSRFLLTRPDVFWFRQDAQHTTRVGLACNHS